MKTTKEIETITKEKIALHLKEQIGLSSLICEEIVLNIFSELLELTKSTGKTSLPNFGTWKIHNKKERPGFNIQTGDTVNIEARTVLQLSPAQSLKHKINNSDVN
ncbi:MAG: HU family DNA-binding protein [Rickettsiaceae bacterium]|nr:HU family DNA-binding protein [Rickettsiaceae bacterium]